MSKHLKFINNYEIELIAGIVWLLLVILSFGLTQVALEIYQTGQTDKQSFVNFVIGLPIFIGIWISMANMIFEDHKKAGISFFVSIPLVTFILTMLFLYI